MKAVFDTKASSGYDDDVVRHYHFPNRYLAVALEAVGDWVVYREPRRNGGREGYVAAAQVLAIEPDPGRPGHSYARMSGYLPFDTVVPLQGTNGFFEHRLRAVASPSLRGAALQGRSVRSIEDDEFDAIVCAGLANTLSPANAIRLGLSDGENIATPGVPMREPPCLHERDMVPVLLNRRIRDAAFRHDVLAAYQDTCAVTSLRIVNGGGRAEAQAAHIVPVADGGPDVVQNGIALSATVHWLFDRHLISLTDDYGLLVSHNQVPDELRAMFGRQLARIHLPADPATWPHPAFVRHHRERFANKH